MRIALAIALLEAVLIVFGVVSGWVALLVGGVVLALYFVVVRRVPNSVVRDAGWTAALSQALVAFVPVATFVFGVLVLLALGIAAVALLFLLLADRR